MKILWTVNLIPAQAAGALNIKSGVFGGWVESMAEQLKDFEDIELAVACKSDTGLTFSVDADGVHYYSLAYTAGTDLASMKAQCADIIAGFAPDLIQIEGTEFLHAKAMMETASEKKIPAVVSMQGILNGQYAYQCGQLELDDMMFSRSVTDIFSAWIMHLRKTRWYAPRMKPEREIIEQAEYVLGRTTWDRAHTYAINPDAEYFTCSRVLRPAFYNAEWKLENAERHSIYVGNSYRALKGFHFLVKALPQLIREYPDIKIYVGGDRPYAENDKRSVLKKGYGAYLQKLVTDLKVGSHIIFTGPLTAEQVADRLSRVNAYVLTSVVENSPNTLGEAMLVGTPCVASYAGGVPDMAADGKEALFYRSNDPALLAWNIKRIFDSDELALSLSAAARARASVTHNARNNAEALVGAYRSILGEKG